ncbi:MAG TPA: PEP-CTERM sorting domain-containing protein [candidate division Zixibacteria bacterium]|nr:PEP-CTERM sorting domain-containing protein [candidate division Zixibacteria bacterium]
MSRFLTLTAITLFFAAATTSSFAASIGPSDMVWWTRGDAGTTWQEWYFNNDDNPAIPDTSFNPFGTPSVEIYNEGDEHGAIGWYPERWERLGVWHGEFTDVTINIPNVPEFNLFKEIWVEVGFIGHLMPHPDYPDYPEEIYGPKVTPFYGDLKVAYEVEMIGLDIEQLGDYSGGAENWQKLTIGWRIYPNPLAEEIYLAFHNSGADIDYIVIDTICAIPEPSTMIMLGLGLLVILVRRSK